MGWGWWGVGVLEDEHDSGNDVVRNNIVIV
jgi:hypothetical protein